MISFARVRPSLYSILDFLMLKFAATAIVFCLFVTPSLAQETSANENQNGYEVDYAAAAKLQEALKRHDVRAVASLIQYPFGRERPLSDIKDSEEFAQDFDDYFDSANINRVLSAKAEQIGWRGIQLARGAVWFNNGKIVAMNLRTDAYAKKFSDAKRLEERFLYPAVRGYDHIEFECDTRNLHVRTQYTGNDLQYFAWKKHAPLTSRPLLMLNSGKIDFQGSGGNHSLTFRNGAYMYQLWVVEICGDDCNNYLDISKDSRTLSHQVCD